MSYVFSPAAKRRPAARALPWLALSLGLVSGTAVASPFYPVTPIVDGAPTATARNSNMTDWLVFDRLNERPSDFDALAMDGPAPIQLAANGDLAQLGGMAGRGSAATLPNGAWFRGFGSFLFASGRDAAPAYKTRTGGFLTGFDRPVGDRLTLGVAAGYSNTAIAASDGSSGTIDTPRLIVYGRYALGRLAIDASAGLAYDRVHTIRNLPTQKDVVVESHNGFEQTAAVQANYRLPVRGIALMPLVGLQYARLSENKFAESGSTLGITAPGMTTDSLQAMVGATASADFATAGGVQLRPGARLTVGRELLGTSRTLAVTSLGGSITRDAGAASPARTTVTMGPSLAAQLSQRLALTADYQVELGLGRSIAHDVFVGARYAF